MGIPYQPNAWHCSKCSPCGEGMDVALNPPSATAASLALRLIVWLLIAGGCVLFWIGFAAMVYQELGNRL